MSEKVKVSPLPPEIQIEADIKLRLLEPDDSQKIFEILQEGPEIQEFITWTAGLKSAEDIQLAIKGFQQNGEARYAILDETELVGYIGIFPTRFEEQYPGEYDLGYFCAPSKRGNAYVPKAVNSLMAAATQKLPVNSFALFIEDRNSASQSVATKLGFHRTEFMARDEILNCVERRYEKPVTELD